MLGADPGSPLEGIRILELGGFIAGPFAGQQLGDLGAQVIKIEPPRQGDPMRQWRDHGLGQDLWWPSLGRNKRSVTVDVGHPDGAALVRRLVPACHVLLENFRPGRLEEWGFGPDVLLELNPALVITRVSGYGQDGPLAAQPGFGSIGEAMGGIRHLTGWPDRPAARVGISLGDSLASLFAVIGTLAALRHAERTGEGQVVDVSIFESVFALMESSLAEYELAGVERIRTGSTLPGVAPSNLYPTADGSDVLIAANADAIFNRLVAALGAEELAEDERFATHVGRGRHSEELDARLAGYTAKLTEAELLTLLRQAGVPAGKVYTAADISRDEHYQARGSVLRLPVEGLGEVPMPAPVPRLGRTPGRVRWPGRSLGADTRAVLAELAGCVGPELDALQAEGVV